MMTALEEEKDKHHHLATVQFCVDAPALVSVVPG
jgi:hypothetical protein